MATGLIHLYTGEGKGKTTASLGLALRASGAGKQVLFVQFLKGWPTSELNSLHLLPNVQIIRNEKRFGFWSKLSEQEKEEERQLHNQNLQKVRELVQQKKVDVLILDEAVGAYSLQALDRRLLEELIEEKPAELEIVVTGRNPEPFFLEKANYITEMKKHRHPKDQGIVARKGIEF
ncbi:MAG: cob(I)yrinic acid a,c-diamide adenosyltransferase [Clostridia bacterium]|nr:cob(I)yrinic acid a,c-diamide adenosyltransferase [Clostridia bacterium]